MRYDHAWRLLAALVAAAMLGHATQASAQVPNGQAPQIEVTRFVNLKGHITALRPGMIGWTEDGETPMFVKLTDKTQVVVLGTAEPNFLRPGMFVRFSAAEITNRGMIEAPVDKLTIFSPRDGYSIGVFSDSDDPTDESGPVLVAGQLRGLRNGKFILLVGNQQVRGELSEDVEIKVEVSDYGLAYSGDEITVTGLGFQRDKIEAERIEIKLAETLGEKQEKRPARRGRAKQ